MYACMHVCICLYEVAHGGLLWHCEYVRYIYIYIYIYIYTHTHIYVHTCMQACVLVIQAATSGATSVVTLVRERTETDSTEANIRAKLEQVRVVMRV